MIGIIGAMHEEVIDLKNAMEHAEEYKVAGMIFYMGLLENKMAVLVESGIGKVNATICTTVLIEKFRVEKIIFTGVAGGINPGLDVGDIVISKDLIEHDVDATAFGSKHGEIPRMETSTFKATSYLSDLAKRVAENLFKTERKVVLGRILSGDQFISSKEKIEWLRETFNGDCAEMEGAAVAHVCYLYNLDFVIIRSISDKADHSAKVDFAEFVHLASKISRKIVQAILKELQNN